jgi:acetyl esterase/lipase
MNTDNTTIDAPTTPTRGAYAPMAAYPVIPLWPEDAPGIDTRADEHCEEPGKFTNIRNPTLTVYEPPPDLSNGTAAIVCPGGGYGMVSCPNEGHPVALWLMNTLGVSAYVLKYRLPSTPDVNYRHPVPLNDAQRSIRLVRESAASRGLRPDRIGIVGFSAGAHLAATACTLFDQPVVDSPVSCRPDFAILLYPVISFTDACCHEGSRRNLLGTDDPEDSLCALLSPDQQVSRKTPPAFLAHARNDNCVPWRNSQRYHEALLAQGIPSELHLYEQGAHGFGMGEPHQDAYQWASTAAGWLREQGFIPA